MGESKEEMEARHQREVKKLKGQTTRMFSAIDKKDKKKKAEAKARVQQMEQDLKARHEEEIRALGGNQHANAEGEGDGDEGNEGSGEGEGEKKVEVGGEDGERSFYAAGAAGKTSRKQRRRQAKAQREQQQHEEAEKLRPQGPTARQLEDQALAKALARLSLRVKDVQPDGHCLFRAVDDQLRVVQGGGVHGGFAALRTMAANHMRANADDFAPFVEDEGGLNSYCHKMESTAAWGGDMELNALANALQCKIVVHQASGAGHTFGDQFDGAPLHLTYHRHSYSLGEHYNSAVPVSGS